MCVCMCAYVYVDMHICTYMWNPEANFGTLSFSLFDVRSLAVLELISLASLAGQ